MSEVTRILDRVQQGDPKAAEKLLPLVYEELRKLAAHKMANEAPGQTLQPTALVHEAWLRLVEGEGQQWDGRGHFFAAAAEAMRRILVENARRKRALRHGGGQERVDIGEVDAPQAGPDEELLAVHEALDEFARADAVAAQLVKLRYFAGLSMPEAAEAFIGPALADDRAPLELRARLAASGNAVLPSLARRVAIGERRKKLAGSTGRISHGWMETNAMNANQQNASAREREIFLQALDLDPPGERAAFLDGACGGDAELRATVEALLANHRADSFLEGPAAGVGQTIRLDPAIIAPVTETPGDRIGRYKLREKVGEGGCGVVYVAEQEEPVRRRVALKVIKLGMDSKSVVARFDAERQALAMMDHPNIARVLDAGATDTGRPYFVMELVRGIKITDYCDKNKLATGERLDLFIKVCQAVQHAHQKGIIHRDLKPSNILVTLHDGVPVPKVIDFGIAKATEGRLTDLTIYTELHQFIGTPAYVSPEQAEMSGLDIDTRADIYSLGVLLYELLTGQTPFSSEELLRVGFDEMRRTICEQEPVRPSTRLSTMLEGELTATAKRHGADAPKLIHLIRGDLDWIVMKSLEKDRTRRYETANALAADLKRHLNNEAIVARPPSTSYRLQKAVRRNKLAFAAALLVGIFVASWQAVRASQTGMWQFALCAAQDQTIGGRP